MAFIGRTLIYNTKYDRNMIIRWAYLAIFMTFSIVNVLAQTNPINFDPGPAFESAKQNDAIIGLLYALVVALAGAVAFLWWRNEKLNEKVAKVYEEMNNKIHEIYEEKAKREEELAEKVNELMVEIEWIKRERELQKKK